MSKYSDSDGLGVIGLMFFCMFMIVAIMFWSMKYETNELKIGGANGIQIPAGKHLNIKLVNGKQVVEVEDDE